MVKKWDPILQTLGILMIPLKASSLQQQSNFNCPDKSQIFRLVRNQNLCKHAIMT